MIVTLYKIKGKYAAMDKHFKYLLPERIISTQQAILFLKAQYTCCIEIRDLTNENDAKNLTAVTLGKLR